MQNDKMRSLIMARITALKHLEEEAQAGCETVTLDQTRVGRLSRMDAMQSQAMNQAAQRRRGMEIAALQAALERIKLGEYGECESCGEEISEGRLMIDPAVRLCIHCAQHLEQQ